MLFKIKEYFFYILRSLRTKNTNISFLVQFKKIVLKQKITIPKVDNLRNYYKCNNTKIQVEDYGAGSKTIKKNTHLNTKDLYFNVAISKKYGEILFKLVSFLKANKVLELGTSLGISAAYMHQANVISVEGNKELAKNSAKVLKKYNFDSIEILNSKFGDILSDLMKENKFDLIFIDGNHTQKATLEYFESCLKVEQKKLVVIFDDIYWSKGMKMAWKNIKQHKQVNLSIDLFKFGIVFIDKEIIDKEEITLWY